MYWLHTHFHSETLNMPVPMEVLLPESYVGTGAKYPALYLLHDMGDGHTTWLRKTNLESYLEEFSIAAIMPAAHLSYYADMFCGKKYFTYITEELPAICERLFPLSTEREDRMIAGTGIGGYGALKAGMYASDNFSIAASFSSPIDINNIAARVHTINSADIFGPDPDLKGSRHDLYAAEKIHTKTHFYLDCETTSEFYHENLLFAQHLEHQNLIHSFIEMKAMTNVRIQQDISLQNFVKWLADHKTTVRKEDR
ncbi:esterase family protein [Gracilibacillus oryzae]|uniref:Esterase family protein n=1 Tax=Gracilibacillus oryzae TaxID=1672701 RepID=A0A7C8KPR1_9BACI|nr:alpha/beta hydrolase-fold protein [Gracilibacillus oryzae]KAB8125932.1 esterase family protein [Gracilibacillus oryzae]